MQLGAQAIWSFGIRRQRYPRDQRRSASDASVRISGAFNACSNSDTCAR
jgi:hypothetical protein